MALLAVLAGAAWLLSVPVLADQVQHASTPSEAQAQRAASPGAPGRGVPTATVPGPPPGAPPLNPAPTAPGPGPQPGASAPPPAQAGKAPAPGTAHETPQRPVPGGLEALYHAGVTAARHGDAKAAERDFKRVLARAPYHFLANLELGRLYLARQAKLATPYLETAARLHPSSAEVHALLGRAYEALGRDLDAAEQYRRAIYLNPHEVAANARLRNMLKRMRAQRSPVERAADVFYQHPSLARLTLFGRIVMEQMDPRQAALEFEEVAQRVPDLPEVQLWLARARHAANDLPGEVSAYRRYLQQRPQATGVRLLVVQRLMTQGWYDEAAGLLAPLIAPANGTGGPGQQQGTQAANLAPGQRARVTFLHSRLLAAQGHSGQAGTLLVKAAGDGYAADKIGAAFTEDLELHPDSGALQLAYGRWLLASKEPAKAAAALGRAGRLDAAQRPQARTLLLGLRQDGQAPLATALALGELDWADGDGQAALAVLAEIPPGSTLDHRAALLRGLIYRSQGKDEASLDAFLRYVLFFTDRADQLYARGNVFWRTGHPEEALALWQAHPDVLVKHPDVLEYLAEHQRKAGDVAGEIATRERLSQALPDNAANRIRLGELYDGQGQRLKAVQLWEQVLRQRPRDAALLARVGKAWLALGQSELGMHRLEQAAELQALDPATAAMLAGELYRSHQYEAALRIYWSLYQEQPDQPDLPRVLPELVKDLPATHAQQAAAAKLAVQAGRLDAAVPVLQAMVDEDPDDTDARMSLAEVYLRENEPSRAEAVLVAPGASGAADEQGLRLLAKVQERLGRKAELDDTLARLQQLHPDDPKLMRRRALLLFSLRDYQRAHAMLQVAVTRMPKDEQLQLALANTALALHHPAEAEQHFEAVLAVNPNQNEALRRVINLLLVQQRWAEVVPRLKTWLKLNPNDATAYYNLISADLKLFHKEDARPYYEALRKLSPQRAAPLDPYFP